ncbi:MAG TPA: hypothetical protein VFT80_13980 [Actinomycetota bacterium]|nr:hypothetical protein [Actinomycetota bacterium]
MSDRLRQSLMSSRSEIVAGLAEAEAELARVRQRAGELEELIALGTATLLAAEMISGGAKGTPEPAAEAPAPEPSAEPAPEPSAESEPFAEPAPEPAADVDPAPEAEVAAEPIRGATYEDDLRALLERAQS